MNAWINKTESYHHQSFEACWCVSLLVFWKQYSELGIVTEYSTGAKSVKMYMYSLGT